MSRRVYLWWIVAEKLAFRWCFPQPRGDWTQSCDICAFTVLQNRGCGLKRIHPEMGLYWICCDLWAGNSCLWWIVIVFAQKLTFTCVVLNHCRQYMWSQYIPSMNLKCRLVEWKSTEGFTRWEWGKMWGLVSLPYQQCGYHGYHWCETAVEFVLALAH